MSEGVPTPLGAVLGVLAPPLRSRWLPARGRPCVAIVVSVASTGPNGTAGACWNAGVECSPDVETGLGACWPADKAADGGLAVMYELSSHVALDCPVLSL